MGAKRGDAQHGGNLCMIAMQLVIVIVATLSYTKHKGLALIIPPSPIYNSK